MQMNTSNDSANNEDEIANWLNDTDKGIKRAMRLREVAEDTLKDIMNGYEFKPSHLVRSLIFHLLFTLEASGQISFSYDDVFEWIESKKALYEYVGLFDRVFEFKKSPGRPTEDSTSGISILMPFLQAGIQLGKPTNSEEVYWVLLSRATEIRLANCEEFSTHRSAYDMRVIYAREFKAAKTNIDRFWHKFQDNRPPRLDSNDRAMLKEEVLRHLASRK